MAGKALAGNEYSDAVENCEIEAARVKSESIGEPQCTGNCSAELSRE
jgi:hypothetical protein